MTVLFVRFSAIGDCIMTAWAATALRETHPEIRLVWAVQSRCAPVIDTGSLVDEIHLFPREEWKKHRWSLATWRDQLLRYTSLRKQGIEVGFDFQGHSKTALCLRLAGCKERYAGRATDAFAARLNPPVALNSDGPHEVQHAHALVRHKFDVGLPERPLMPVPKANESGVKSGSLVTIQTGAGEPDKRYPVESWGTVAQGLQAKGHQVVAIGSDSDPKINLTGVQDEVGKRNLFESLSLVAGSQLHLAGDTGTGHAAAAYGIPVVSVFGRTDPARFRPWTKNGRVLRAGPDPSLVAPEDVLDAALALLEGCRVARAR